MTKQTLQQLGKGCGLVGRPFGSNTRDPWFESSHRQFSFSINCIKSVLKDENKEKKRPGLAVIFNTATV